MMKGGGLDWFGWSRRGDRGVVAGWVKVGGEGERSEAGAAPHEGRREKGLDDRDRSPSSSSLLLGGGASDRGTRGVPGWARARERSRTARSCRGCAGASAVTHHLGGWASAGARTTRGSAGAIGAGGEIETRREGTRAAAGTTRGRGGGRASANASAACAKDRERARVAGVARCGARRGGRRGREERERRTKTAPALESGGAAGDGLLTERHTKSVLAARDRPETRRRVRNSSFAKRSRALREWEISVAGSGSLPPPARRHFDARADLPPRVRVLAFASTRSARAPTSSPARRFTQRKNHASADGRSRGRRAGIRRWSLARRARRLRRPRRPRRPRRLRRRAPGYRRRCVARPIPSRGPVLARARVADAGIALFVAFLFYPSSRAPAPRARFRARSSRRARR